MACKKCGSDWVTALGCDCKTCPHCCKQQRHKARSEGRWVEPTAEKLCEECGAKFTAVGLHDIKLRVLCHDPQCRKSRKKKVTKASRARRAEGVFVLPRKQKQKRCCKFSKCGKELTRRDQKEYCDRACYFAAIDAGEQQFKGRVRDEWAGLVDWAYEWDALRPRPRKKRRGSVRPPCQHCGKEINSGSSRFCSYACVKNWRGTRQCDACGVDVPRSNSFSKCRCETCRERLRKEANRRGKNRCGRNHRQRARHHGVAYLPVPVKAVYERDGYRCQICRRRCLKSAMFSKTDGRIHPRSPTIDHIVPMACGGNHEPGNLQTACHACNSAKGARAAGQLRLAFV